MLGVVQIQALEIYSPPSSQLSPPSSKADLFAGKQSTEGKGAPASGKVAAVVGGGIAGGTVVASVAAAAASTIAAATAGIVGGAGAAIVATAIAMTAALAVDVHKIRKLYPKARYEPAWRVVFRMFFCSPVYQVPQNKEERAKLVDLNKKLIARLLEEEEAIQDAQKACRLEKKEIRRELKGKEQKDERKRELKEKRLECTPEAFTEKYRKTSCEEIRNKIKALQAEIKAERQEKRELKKQERIEKKASAIEERAAEIREQATSKGPQIQERKLKRADKLEIRAQILKENPNLRKNLIRLEQEVNKRYKAQQ